MSCLPYLCSEVYVAQQVTSSHVNALVRARGVVCWQAFGGFILRKRNNSFAHFGTPGVGYSLISSLPCIQSFSLLTRLNLNQTWMSGVSAECVGCLDSVQSAFSSSPLLPLGADVQAFGLKGACLLNNGYSRGDTLPGNLRTALPVRAYPSWEALSLFPFPSEAPEPLCHRGQCSCHGLPSVDH